MQTVPLFSSRAERLYTRPLREVRADSLPVRLAENTVCPPMAPTVALGNPFTHLRLDGPSALNHYMLCCGSPDHKIWGHEGRPGACFRS